MIKNKSLNHEIHDENPLGLIEGALKVFYLINEEIILGNILIPIETTKVCHEIIIIVNNKMCLTCITFSNGT